MTQTFKNKSTQKLELKNTKGFSFAELSDPKSPLSPKCHKFCLRTSPIKQKIIPQS